MNQNFLRQADLDNFTPKGQCPGGLGGRVWLEAGPLASGRPWLKVSVSSKVKWG